MAIREWIASGAYEAHSYLPSERELCEKLDTSRRSVSAALEKLEAEGLVVQTPGRGTRVLPPMERMSNTTIGIACTYWPVFPSQLTQILHGVSDALSRRGYRYEISMTEAPSNSAVSLAELTTRFGALLCLHTFARDAEILALEQARYPVVVAGLEVKLNVCGTWVDHRKTTRTAMRMLTGMGHRRIAFLGAELSRYFYPDAIAGYEDGLREAGIPKDEALIIASDRPDVLNAYLATKALLELPDPPTGIICGRDYLAQGVCRAAQEAGLTIGRDMSVVGFDDNSWHQDEPFLTTFREPCVDLGTLAAEMLIARIVHGWSPPERREVEAPLIFRRSVGPLLRAPDAAPLAASAGEPVAGVR